MKTLNIPLNILFLAASIAAANSQPSPAAKPVPASDRFQTAIGKLYEGYLSIQQDLSQDDFQKSKTDATSLFGLVKAVPTGALDKAGKARWDSSAAALMKTQHLMTASKDIDAMRASFKPLTPQIVGVIEKFGMKGASSAWLIHCPMANADWIQKDKKTMNPYYGKDMQECGELVREVKKR